MKKLYIVQDLPAGVIDNISPDDLFEISSGTSTAGETPGGGNIGDLTKQITFSTVLKFQYLLSVSSKNMTGDITFTKSLTDAVVGGSTLVKLLANGVNVPNFSNFRKINGSSDFKNVAGILNLIYFFYDGKDVWYNIWQDDNGLVEGEDPGEPEVPGAPVNIPFDKLAPGGVTYNSSTNLLSVFAGGRGASYSVPITLKNNMEFIQEMTSSVLLTLDTDLDENYNYGSGNSYIIGVFMYGGSAAYADVNGVFKATVNASSTITKMKIVKNGNDADCYYTTDGTTWIKFYTEVGCFYGITEVYIKIVPTDTATTKVTRTT